MYTIKEYYMESAYFVTGISTSKLLKLVGRNGISFQPKYMKRFGFLFYSSLWTSVMTVLERLQYAKTIKEKSYTDDPVIIVGHWRSGSTYLHQLLNMCPHLVAPNLFQIGTPDSFLSSRKILEPFIRLYMRPKRTVDNVAISIDEPQEDEFALFRMTTFSPIERLIFPSSSDYFLKDDDTFLPPKDMEKQWQDSLYTFCKKLYIESGKRIVLKNPFHSMRIPHLRKLFPKAKFIHIYRNPLSVIPSTVRMWTIVGQQNALRDNFTPPSLGQVVDVYGKIMSKMRKDLDALPKEDSCEIRFECMEKNPVKSVKNICQFLDIPFTKDYGKNLHAFLESTKNYRKNKYSISKHEASIIKERLKDHMRYYKYRV